MKNYLGKSVFKIKSTNWHFRDRAEEGDIFDLYCQANQHSLNTYRKYLQGDWEYLYLTGECETINDQFIYKFWRLHDLWHSEPCNIFYADADTIAIKPFNPWNYDKFMMFNYTDPKRLVRNDKVMLEHYFNAGITYFPHTMKPEVWGLGRHLASNWDKNIYDTEQVIYNEMLWSQKVQLEEVLDVSMNFSFFINWDQSSSEIYNGYPVDHAKILHFHGSRNILQTVQLMDSFVPSVL